MIPFFQHPELGDSRELSYQLWQSVEAWFHWQQASFNYQRVLLEVWIKTAEEFLQMLALGKEGAASINPQMMQHWQQWLSVWSQSFDRKFAQTFQSDDALQIRGQYLTAAATLKKQQQQVLDVILKWNDLPTRSEIDEIHRNIYELRKEMKQLKQAFIEPRSD
ncbi:MULTISPECIES: poly(R)-hydroxyalkanoic acid synthase subunit PhaE [unclassified Leptolyngbya]|uniref:poly(R)-hydroxyalkanoic acid synthase subunit PhaE n=1 Tax=unclassified Leptolyngbya TaxID=2650499 RepID=UPI0016873BAD|nr:MULTISPECIES: poly(R)-hydroxyalkanoic acid synthase subunit PhaE [unclassified Leptolyngbya]MBD1909038.1 hypothetical protein [Leptolyngbya sp. FACHB-8]MBD2153030.1 hypothetical protein [Leptolyngbya sp. FACHB-16]